MPTKITKKTTRRRTPKAVEPEAVQPIAAVPEPEPAPVSIAEPEKAPDSIINRVYIGTYSGVQEYEGPQAWPLIKEIKEVAGEDDTPFTLFEDGRPVYFAVRASEVRPITFPDPGPAVDEYGVTSAQMYGWTVTFASTIARIVELETRAKGGLLGEAKKIMTLALPIVAAIFAIFIMAVILTG